MKTITIYIVKTEDYYRHGAPATYRLEEPYGLSREWIERAEYELPEEYTTAMSNMGMLEIYNAAGKHCPILGSLSRGEDSGAPILLDADANPSCVKLQKLRELPW